MLEALSNDLEQKGLMMPLDLGAKGRCVLELKQTICPLPAFLIIGWHFSVSIIFIIYLAIRADECILMYCFHKVVR